jgi:hypothetical protein
MIENEIKDDPRIKLDEVVPRSDYSINVEQRNRNYAVNSVKNRTLGGLIEIREPSLVSLILKTYGDLISRNILKSVARNPMTIMGMLDYCGMPKTTGYRKCISLIENKFLVPYDTVHKGGKSVTKYLASISTLQIQIQGNDISVKVEFSDAVPWKRSLI